MTFVAKAKFELSRFACPSKEIKPLMNAAFAVDPSANAISRDALNFEQ